VKQVDVLDYLVPKECILLYNVYTSLFANMFWHAIGEETVQGCNHNNLMRFHSEGPIIWTAIKASIH